VIAACRGELISGDPAVTFAAISTDSRDIKPGDLFVPLSGETFDGHDFAIPALEAGARGALVHRDITREIPNTHFNYVLIQVQDTLLALSDLASTHRIHCPTPLIAVTGSSGKTTVKEMIAAILGTSHHALVSKGNINNMIGLPMTVLNLAPEHTIAVVEAGINKPDEMKHLARAAAPTVAVITTVGPVHLEGLGSIENVAKEKFELAMALKPEGTAVLPAANPYLAPLMPKCPAKCVTFGEHEGDFRAIDVRFGEETSFTMVGPSGKQPVRLNILGRHSVANALAATAATVAVGMKLSDVAEALSHFRPPSWRMEVVPLENGRRLLRDCYNANPQSVKAALEVLSQGSSSGRTLAILADMAELGERAKELHEEIGREAAALGIDRLVFVGRFGDDVLRGFVGGRGDMSACILVPDRDTAWDVIAPCLEGFGTILVKGSRIMKMELIANRIAEEN
jgi:UDP-N-acetylmuramoyl-tripeptide--D-alanyl-D-alanine ligase